MVRALLFFLVSSLINNSILAQDIRLVQKERPSLADEMSKEQRLLINQRLQRNIDSLKREGILNKAKTTDIKFSFPLLPADNLFDLRYYGITNFVDLNNDFPNQLTDYTCGIRTFDRENGYNHSGTDFSLFPFPWKKMQEDKVAVIAAAPGIIIEKTDGNPDKNCTFSDEEWNAVYIRHEDGSVAWYGSLKANSLTEKNIGDRVEVGEKIGIVGSSGNSTNPHLHFEIQDENGEVIDPFAGECNVSESLWKDQPDYIDTEINNIIITGEYYGENYREEMDLECGEAVVLQDTDAFLDDDGLTQIYFYINDLVKNKPLYGRVTDAEGEVIDSFTFELTDDKQWAEDYYKFSIWEFSFAIPERAQTGIWDFTITMEDGLFNQEDGRITHKFSVSSEFTEPIKTETLNPENGAIIDDSDTYLRWVPMADASFYTVQIAEDESFTKDVKEHKTSIRSIRISELGINKNYYWRVKSQNQYGESEWSEVSYFSTGISTSINLNRFQKPENFNLSQNYPNPFNPTTSIQYKVPESGRVQLAIYNVLGKQVEVLVDQVRSAGVYTVNFEAGNLPSGVYYYKLLANGFTQIKPMTLIK